MEDTTMIIPAIVTLLFILIVRFVGAYFIYKADEKWERNLKNYIDQKTSKNAEPDGLVVSADAKPMTEVV